MNFFLVWCVLRQLVASPGQGSIPPTLPGPLTAVQTSAKDQGTVTAFPNSPKAPPPRVKDIAIPPAPLPPGSTITAAFPVNAPLTADEAVRIALHQQPNLGVSLGAIQIQQGATRQTGALEHPQVFVGAGYDQIQSSGGSGSSAVASAPNNVQPPGVSNVNAYSFGGDVKQLLFDFNMTRNLVRQSQALERSSQQKFTIAQQDLVLNVENAFYNYGDAERVVMVNEGNVANRQRQLDLASARLTNGVGEPSDVATAQTSKSQGILLLIIARDAAEQSRIVLLQQMGVDPLTPVILSDGSALEPKETDAHALTATAIRLRPEVKAAIEALAAAKYGLSAARALDLPALYAELGAGFSGSGFPLDTKSANLSLGFQFPLFDGGNRAGAVKGARGQITTANANLQTAVLQVRTDVASAVIGLKSAEQRVSISANEVFNAQEDLRIAEGRYAAGIGLFQDITTAQALLLTSQTDQETARNNLDLARTKLRRATGELLDSIH